MRAAASRITAFLTLGILPAAVLVLMFAFSYRSNSLAVDFRNEIYSQAKLILDGANPYPTPGAEIQGSNHLWPALVAILATPLTILGPTAAGVVVVIAGICCFGGALWLVGNRDWRIYGAFALWAPVAGEMRTAHLTPLLCLLVAVAWRTRDRITAPGLAVGAAVALKFLLWPLVLWLVATRRPRAAVVAGLAAASSLLLLLPFIDLVDYAHLLRRVGATFDQYSFTPFGLLVQAGAPEGVSRVVALGVGLAVLAVAWRRRSFTLFVAVALLLSPIVWLDYYAIVAVPLAVARPTFDAVWLLPVLTWGITGAGAVGHAAPTARVLVIFAVVVWWSERGERRLRDGHALSSLLEARAPAPT